MLKVTFYVLTSERLTADLFACRLAAKAWRDSHTIHIHTNDKEASLSLDRLLWEWREDSFIPHQLNDANMANNSPITIDYNAAPNQAKKILINLTPSLHPFYNQFDRVCEIVAHTTDSIKISREKFNTYKQANIQPETHKIGAAE